MDNNINLIDLRLAQLRALITRFRAYSTTAETTLANKIISIELKRFEAIQDLEIKLADLRKLIPIYKARFPANKYVLADQIINLELQIIAAKSNHLAQDQPAPQQLAPHRSAQQPLQSNEMHEISTNRPQQIPNRNWQPSHPIGALVRTFR